MDSSNTFYDMIFDNMRKLAFPEELLKLDKDLAKQDLISLLMIDRVGECTMSQLAERVNFPMSTTTGIVDRLVKKGYVVRYRSEQDRRMVLIDLTDQGKSYAMHTKQSITDLASRLFDVLTESEQALIFSLINKVMLVFSTPSGLVTENSLVKKPVQKINID